MPEKRMKEIIHETNEIVAMIVASIKTLRTNQNKSKIQNLKSKIKDA